MKPAKRSSKDSKADSYQQQPPRPEEPIVYAGKNFRAVVKLEKDGKKNYLVTRIFDKNHRAVRTVKVLVLKFSQADTALFTVKSIAAPASASSKRQAQAGGGSIPISWIE